MNLFTEYREPIDLGHRMSSITCRILSQIDCTSSLCAQGGMSSDILKELVMFFDEATRAAQKAAHAAQGLLFESRLCCAMATQLVVDCQYWNVSKSWSKHHPSLLQQSSPIRHIQLAKYRIVNHQEDPTIGFHWQLHLGRLPLLRSSMSLSVLILTWYCHVIYLFMWTYSILDIWFFSFPF